MVQTHNEYQMKRYNKMLQKYKSGYYDKIYYGSSVNNILIFERPNGKKNGLNITGLEIPNTELDTYKNFFIYS